MPRSDNSALLAAIAKVDDAKETADHLCHGLGMLAAPHSPGMFPSSKFYIEHGSPKDLAYDATVALTGDIAEVTITSDSVELIGLLRVVRQSMGDLSADSHLTPNKVVFHVRIINRNA